MHRRKLINRFNRNRRRFDVGMTTIMPVTMADFIKLKGSSVQEGKGLIGCEAHSSRRMCFFRVVSITLPCTPVGI